MFSRYFNFGSRISNFRASLRVRHFQKRLAGTLVAICLLSVVALGKDPPTRHFSPPNEITFRAEIDDTDQKYVILLPSKFAPKETHDLMIALHGHGSDRWQFATGNGAEMRACRDVALSGNMIYVSPDYRAKTSWMGPKAEADVVQIIRDLKQQYKIERVFIVGASMGGSSCLTFAALHPDMIAGVASMNGTANHLEYNRFQDAIAQSFGGEKTEILDEYKKRSAEYWPEKLTMPVGITASGKDEVVPPDSVRRLGAVLAAMDRPVLVIFREELGHFTRYADAKSILEFVVSESNNLRKPQNSVE